MRVRTDPGSEVLVPIDAPSPADRTTEIAVRRFRAGAHPVRSGRPAPTASRHRFAEPDLSVAGARDLVGRCLAGWGVVPEAVDDARLVVSELVTNAVRHDGARRVDVEVVDLGDSVVLVVECEGTAGDGGPGPALPAASATSGRGLTVVDRVAVRWGRTSVEGGGRVWAVLAAPRATAAAAQRARDRQDLLPRLAEALAGAGTPEQVAAAAAAVTRRGIEASTVDVAVLEWGSRHLRQVGHAPAVATPAAAPRPGSGPGSGSGSGSDRTAADDEPRRDPVTARLPGPAVVRTTRQLFRATRAELVRDFPDYTRGDGADVSAVAVLPLLVEGVTIGTLTVTWADEHDVEPEERGLLAAVAAFTSTALQRATLAAEHRATTEVLQAALLPQSLPSLAGVEIATVYRPVGDHPTVGGDWYDAFELPSGNLFLVIGDVAGHGTLAARTMGKIRYSARAYAIAGAGPGEVLDRTNALLRHHRLDLIASMLCLEYDPVRRCAVVADAGHLPALLLPVRGRAGYLDAVPGPMLGAADDVRYPESTHEIPAGAAVVLFTDGLVERRDEAIDESLADLAGAAAEVRRFARGADRVATALADRRAAAQVVTDDVCLLSLVHA